MHTILGAGGAVGTQLLRELAGAGEAVRLVGRTPRPAPGASQTVAADLADLAQTVQAVAGSRIAYLVVGLPYDTAIWRALWPRILGNTIEACKRAQAKLVFFDNVYMYGKVDGPMTEDTPFHPCSRKGEVRAQIATELLRQMQAGALQALIARAADFYGPDVPTSVTKMLVFDKLARGGTASCLGKDDMPHAYTYVPDAARALVLLARSEQAWNRTWHLPTAPNPPDARAFVALAARALGVPARHKVLGRTLVRIGGWFDAQAREAYEMLYQSEAPYLFDSSRFTAAFGVAATSYATGIEETARAYGASRSAA